VNAGVDQGLRQRFVRLGEIDVLADHRDVHLVLRVLERSDQAVPVGEVGGTVGDIESLPFIEAIRQLGWDVGRENALYVHLTLVPYIASAGELKTKPTQHSVKELTGFGIQPDILLCRAEHPLEKKVKAKIALFCNVEESRVISAPDVGHIYEVPLVFHSEGLDERIVERLNTFTGSPNLTRWRRIVSTLKNPKETVQIAMVGKYVDLTDSYKSLNEALVHGGIANECRVDVIHVDSEKIEDDEMPESVLTADGVLVPMGFGPRGTEGKIAAVRWARENQVPFFGICFGMQMAVIEYARHVCGLERANSSEVDPKTPDPVIDLLPEQRGLTNKGGTMRLGAYPCVVAEGTLARRLYKKGKISERHRHRYEFNEAYRERLEGAGLICSGVSPDGGLVEMVELKDHPWFLATQFHPEFKSRPTDCHPLFKGFIRAALQHKAARREAPLLGGLKVVKR
jgi:CTP synthase